MCFEKMSIDSTFSTTISNVAWSFNFQLSSINISWMLTIYPNWSRLSGGEYRMLQLEKTLHFHLHFLFSCTIPAFLLYECLFLSHSRMLLSHRFFLIKIDLCKRSFETNNIGNIIFSQNLNFQFIIFYNILSLLT